MPMTKAELMNVLREAASKEFEDISPREADYEYSFSAKFERRMDKLICSVRRKQQKIHINKGESKQ